jgi:isopentenyldiphosphate isomerase
LTISIDPTNLEFYGKELTVRPNEAHWKYWYVLRVKKFEPKLNLDEVVEGWFLSLDEVEELCDKGEQFYEPFLEIIKRYINQDKTGLVLEEEPTYAENHS